MNIEQGILIPSTLQPVGAGVTGANYAIVLIAGLSQRCVVKKIGNCEIAAECLCALLGNALELPTLIPVVVTDPRDRSFWFGARDVGYPSLSGRLHIGTSANAQQMQFLAYILSAWSQVGQVISFDELVRNGDRNPGNVLWDGSQFTIIDHERALGIQVMQQNKLAMFATDCFHPQLVASIGNASISAALVQQSLLRLNPTVWKMIAAEFASVPSVVEQHYGALVHIIQNNLGSLVHNVANAMSPMFVRQQS